MTLLADLLLQAPLLTDGVPLGWEEDYLGWRFYIQVAVAPAGSVLPFVLGTSVLGGVRWTDLTKSCQGISWSRGGEPAQRPIAGELSLRLDNRQHVWHPWQSSYHGPGSLTRVCISDGTNIRYCWTGLTTSWKEGSAGLNAYPWIDVVAWESMFLLNEVNDNALVTPVGAGETIGPRMDRLLAKVDWQFGCDITHTTGGSFQATNLAQDILTETYLTVDSLDATVYPGKDGNLKVRDRSIGTDVHWRYYPDDIDPDSTEYANDDERLLGTVALARLGGTEINYTNTAIAGRYQKRSTKRDGLITNAEAADADLQRVADGVLGRGDETYRPVHFSVDSSQSHMARRLLIEGEITDRLTMEQIVDDTRRVVFYSYALCSIHVGVMVTKAGTHWTGVFGLDIEVDSHWTQVGGSLVWGRDTWGAGRTWGSRSYVSFPRARWGAASALWGRSKWSL